MYIARQLPVRFIGAVFTPSNNISSKSTAFGLLNADENMRDTETFLLRTNAHRTRAKAMRIATQSAA